jgi:hypothetical protein
MSYSPINGSVSALTTLAMLRMCPGRKVTTTRRAVAALDALDDRFLDPGPLADLGNAQTGLVALAPGFPDAHPAPPLLCPGITGQTVMITSFPVHLPRNRHPAEPWRIVPAR